MSKNTKHPEKESVSDFVSFMQVLNGMDKGDTQRFIANNHDFIIIKIK